MVNFPVPRATLAWTDGNVEVFIDAASKYGKLFQPPSSPRRRGPKFILAIGPSKAQTNL
jgi:hypothetical protein